MSDALPMDETSRCLDENTLARFFEGALSEAESAALRAHIDVCPCCMDLVAAMAARSSAARAGAALRSTDAASGPGAEGGAAWEPPAVVDDYRLVRPLGHGAMGQVYLAHDRVLDRAVAIKLIRAIQPDAGARARFLVEARAVARLQHPNVVSIYRVGEVDGRPYLVSELVRGKSLDQLLLPLPPDRAVRIGVQLARGLAAAHERGVLHRDIKPANAILTDEGEAKLLDFGLAKLLDRPDEPGLAGVPEAAADTSLPGSPALTRSRSLLGTPLYMAPELWRGEPATPQADIYSLGALLYELLSGRPPHVGDRLEDLTRAVLERPPLPLRQAAPSVDARLGKLVDRCLRGPPAKRYQDADELRQALEALGPRPRRVHWVLLALGVVQLGYYGLRVFHPEQEPARAVLPQPATRLVYQLQEEPALSWELDRLAQDLEDRTLEDRRLEGLQIDRSGEGAGATLRLSLPPDPGRIQDPDLSTYDRFLAERGRGPGWRILALRPDHAAELRRQVIGQNINVLHGRLNRLGVRGAQVLQREGRLVIELPTLDPEALARVRRVLLQTARLEFRLVDSDAPYMRRLAEHVARRRPALPGIAVGHETWRTKDTGAERRDVYLRAPDEAVLRQLLREVPPDLAVPPDHEILFEHSRRPDGSAADGRAGSWRSYYLPRRAALTGDNFLTEDVIAPSPATAPEVSVAYSAEGRRRLARLTGGRVGWRLAIVLDGTILSAPAIEGAVTGGRVRITLTDPADPAALRQAVSELALALQAGTLAAPLTPVTDAP